MNLFYNKEVEEVGGKEQGGKEGKERGGEGGRGEKE